MGALEEVPNVSKCVERLSCYKMMVKKFLTRPPPPPRHEYHNRRCSKLNIFHLQRRRVEAKKFEIFTHDTYQAGVYEKIISICRNERAGCQKLWKLKKNWEGMTGIVFESLATPLSIKNIFWRCSQGERVQHAQKIRRW